MAWCVDGFSGVRKVIQSIPRQALDDPPSLSASESKKLCLKWPYQCACGLLPTRSGWNLAVVETRPNHPAVSGLLKGMTMNTKESAFPKKDPMFAPAAVTVPEFCRSTTLGRTKFYAEVAASRIRILKAGRRTLIEFGEIQAYLDRLAGNGGEK
jgi:hypothetical protein